jgi:hypothetical protein
MAVVPFWSLTLLGGRRESDPQPLAEAMFACLFAAAAPYILFKEGSEGGEPQPTDVAVVLKPASPAGKGAATRMAEVE